MKLLPRVSYHLQLLMDSDIASWFLVYSVATLSLCVSLLLLGSPGYFPI